MNNTQTLPLVLLPGFLCDPRLWDDVLAHLKYDGPVHQIDFKHCKNLQDMVEQLEKISAPKFHLVGFSMGGYISEIFATQNPDRIATLTLVAANVGALSDKEKAGRVKLADMLSRVQYRGMSEKEAARFIHPDSVANAHVVNTIVEMSRAYTSEMYVNQMQATLERIDYSEALSQQGFPVMIVAGREDRVVTLASLQGMHAQIERSKFVILEKSGHYVPLEKSFELSEVIRNFISS
ncbi:alpha/beta fold hydrolase [Bdellovibrio sp. HCB209]|uniref:alpha/beta fold hydrolase n=1 Tax=Bdellovibrio sp. HCB209 TaxID=3394354 RepID=UPI0039B6B5A0